MGDQVAFALSLDFNLQGNASQTLQEVSSLLGNVEQRILNIVTNLNSGLTDASVKLQKQANTLSQSVTTVGNDIKNLNNVVSSANLQQPVADMAVQAAQLNANTNALNQTLQDVAQTSKQASTDIGKVVQQSQAPNDIFKQLRDILLDLSSIDFKNQGLEDIQQAFDSYDKLTNEILPEITRLQREMAASGKEFSESESDMISMAFREKENFLTKERKIKKDLKKMEEQWSDRLLGDLKKQKGLYTELLALKKEDRDLLEDYLKLQAAQGKMAALATGTKEAKEQADALVTQANQAEGANKSIGKLAKGWGLLTGFISSAGGAAGNFFNTIGLGQLAQFASINGLVGGSLATLGDQQEAFHTANYRALGSVKDLSREMRTMSATSSALTKELIQSTVALRSMGASAEETREFNEQIAIINRNTGAGIQQQAKFVKRINATTGGYTAARKELILMQRAAKQLGLTGDDLNTVLDTSSEMAFSLGSMGADAAGKFNKMLLQAAGAAKNLGLDVSHTTGLIAKLHDPTETAAFLSGYNVMGMTIEQRMEATIKRAKEWQQAMKDAYDSGSLEQYNVQQQALAGVLGTSTIEAEKYINTWAAMDVNELKKNGMDLESMLKKTVNVQEELQNATKESGTVARDQQKVIDLAINNIITKMEPIVDKIHEIFKALQKYPSLIDFGVITMMGFGLISMLGTLFNTVKVGVDLFKFFGTTGTGVFQAVANMGRAAFTTIATSVSPAIAQLQTAGVYVKDLVLKIPGIGTAFNGIASITRTALTGIMSYGGTALTAMKGLAAGIAGPLAVAVVGGIAIWKTYQAAVANDEAWKTARKEIAATSKALRDAKQKLADAGALAKGDENVETQLLVAERQLKSLISKQKEERSGIKGWFVDEAALRKERVDQEEKVNSLRAQYNKTMDQQYQKELDAVKNGKMLEGMDAKRYDYLKQQLSETNKVSAEQQTQLELQKQINEAAAQYPEAQMLSSSTATQADIDKQNMRQVTPSPVPEKPTSRIEERNADMSVLNASLIESNKVMAQQITSAVASKASPEEEKVKAQTIISTPIDEQTARPREQKDETEAFEMRRQTDVISSIAEKLDKDTLGGLINLLQQYLPQMAEKDTGLASTSTQWIGSRG
jgi:hypothetical protein